MACRRNKRATLEVPRFREEGREDFLYNDRVPVVRPRLYVKRFGVAF